jgi:hypothetical protein
MTLRVWTAAEAVQARAADDPSIEFVRIVASTVPALGYCSPRVGPERPSRSGLVSAWTLNEDRPRQLDLRRVDQVGATNLGGLFAPPSSLARDGVSWPEGRYLFIVGDRWIGVDIEVG